MGLKSGGNTPIKDGRVRHLKGHLQKFKAADFSADFRCYNLIVLTDGEPNPDSENESDISDQEDAKKNKPAFGLVRKGIIEVAQKLDVVDVEPGQVSRKFCQIGSDHDATVFFE